MALDEYIKFSRTKPGVAVTKDDWPHAVVVDHGNDRLQILSAEGAFIASGHIEVSGGSKGLQDVAVDHNGNSLYH